MIAGGRQNTNSGQTATIGGGERSVASGAWATVGGGHWNTSSGSTATVPGGRLNTAGGARSFAAGTQAKALHDGTFVWGDSTLSDFASTAANQVLLRASGGVGIGLNNPQAQLDVSSGGGFNSPQLAVRQTSPSDFARIRLQASGPAWDIALSPGAGAASSLRFWNGAADNLTLQDNGNANLRGTLFQGSDRNTKERVEPVNASAVLEKVLELPLNTWSYTNSPSVRHLGPMAQDFHGAFGLGDTDRGIASVDADGVALAAIQGLNGKLEEQLRQKDEEISDLKKRLEKLERLVGK